MSAFDDEKDPSPPSAAACEARLLRAWYSLTRSSRPGADEETILSLMRASRAPNSRKIWASAPSRPARPLIWLNSVAPNGMWYSITLRMFGRFTPSPNALVLTMQQSSPARNAPSTRRRSWRERPAL